MTPRPFMRILKLNYVSREGITYVIPTGSWIEETGTPRHITDMHEDSYSLVETPIEEVRNLFIEKYGYRHYSKYFSSSVTAFRLDEPIGLQDPFSLTEEYFDSISSTYADEVESNPIQKYMRTATRSFLRKHIAKGDSLLDLGCGPMLETWDLSNMVNLEGADISSKMLEEASAKLKDPTVVLRKTDMKLGGHFGNYDVIFSSYGLTELVDSRTIRDFLERHLKRGGKFVFAFWNRFGILDLALSTMKGRTGYIKERMHGTVHPGTSRFPMLVEAVRPEEIIPPDLFRVIEKKGLCFITPPYNYDFAKKRKMILKITGKIDSAFAKCSVFAPIADYTLIAAVRK